MQGIDNPINAIDDLVALLLQLSDLGARGLQLGPQRITLPLDVAARVIGNDAR